jgi:hypothetical protein
LADSARGRPFWRTDEKGKQLINNTTVGEGLEKEKAAKQAKGGNF